MTEPAVGDKVPWKLDRGPRANEMGYLPGLDGVRALAVIGVLLYHADLSWLPGGFLGVDVFFVLSGFLITSLILEEFDRSGRVDFRKFYLGRARRLLPALLLVLVVVSLAAALVYRDAARQTAADKVPVGRSGEKNEIARLALFLCSEDAAYIIGQTIVADGGTTALMSLISDFRNPSKAKFGTGYVPGV